MDDHTLVGRTVDVIGAVLGDGSAVSLADLTRRTGIPKPTVRRIADSLVDRQVLAHEGGVYSVGPRLLSFGARAIEQRGDRDLAMPHMQEVLARNPASIVFFVDVRNPDHVALAGTVFNRLVSRRYSDARWPHDLTQPAVLATALGRLVLAHYPDRIEPLLRTGVPQLTGLTLTSAGQVALELRRALEEGAAVEHQNVRRGWSCMAVPIPIGGLPSYVLGVAAPTSLFDVKCLHAATAAAAAAIHADSEGSNLAR